MEIRKEKEAEFHDKIRDRELEMHEREYKYLTSNRKFYSIAQKNISFVVDYLVSKYQNKRVLDYCCGDGSFTIFLAKKGINMIGIDISEVSIQNGKNLIKKEDLEDRISLSVMDAEKTEFPDNYFDGVLCAGVLHHLNIENAFKEMRRILKPEGAIICNEPLAYNPVFQLYRRLTPHLRTKWEIEHILSKSDINLAKKYFGKIEIKFFHLATLLAVPFRNLPGFESVLSFLEGVDSVILKLPGLQWLAWQVIFILSEPKK